MQSYAEDRRWWMLSGRGGSRFLLPHERTEINWPLTLTRESLAEFAKDYDAKKLCVQVGLAWVNYTTSDKFTNHNGPPDWRNEEVERTNILDAEDAAAKACK